MSQKTSEKNIKWLWITLLTFIVLLLIITIWIIQNNKEYKIDFERSNCVKFDVDWKCDNTEEQMEKCYEKMKNGGTPCRNSCSGVPIYKCEELIVRRK